MSAFFTSDWVAFIAGALGKHVACAASADSSERGGNKRGLLSIRTQPSYAKLGYVCNFHILGLRSSLSSFMRGTVVRPVSLAVGPASSSGGTPSCIASDHAEQPCYARSHARLLHRIWIR